MEVRSGGWGWLAAGLIAAAAIVCGGWGLLVDPAHPPGPLTPRQDAAVMLCGGLLALALAASGARAAREAARERAERDHQDLFFAMSIDMLCIAGLDGYFRRLNPAWQTTLGHTLDELRAQPYLDFVHPDDREATLAEMARLAGGGDAVAFENRYRCKDGSYRWILWNAAPRLDRRLVYAVAHDVTARKAAEDAVHAMAASRQEAYHELQKAYHELQKTEGQLVQAEKMSSLGQMVAGVAHEINNPLAFVTNNVAVLRRDVAALRDVVLLYQRLVAAPPDQHEPLRAQIDELIHRVDLTYVVEGLDGLLDRTGHGVRRIQQIVKDLRNFARLDEADLHEVDLNEGVRSTVNIIIGQAKAARVELHLDLGVVPAVTCYPGKINQVVLNLLSNAIDATPAGGVVVLRTRTVSDGVEVSVVDSGSGIDPAIRDRVFDPFFTTKPVGKGTGLGLSISYGIVQSHGGRIRLESTPGAGTTFTVWLPLTAVPRKPPAAEASLAAPM